MTTSLDRDRSARIVALFAALVHSWEKADVREAAAADAELRELGVTVRLPGRRTRKPQGSRADA